MVKSMGNEFEHGLLYLHKGRGCAVAGKAFASKIRRLQFENRCRQFRAYFLLIAFCRNGEMF